MIIVSNDPVYIRKSAKPPRFHEATNRVHVFKIPKGYEKDIGAFIHRNTML